MCWDEETGVLVERALEYEVDVCDGGNKKRDDLCEDVHKMGRTDAYFSPVVCGDLGDVHDSEDIFGGGWGVGFEVVFG